MSGFEGGMVQQQWTLNEVAAVVGGEVVRSFGDVVIQSVVSSGDHGSPSSLFVAYRGANVDGHDFIDQAFENGSVAALVSDAAALKGRPGVLVEDSRRALSRLTAACEGHPSKDLLTFGITGTNGKTTIHWLLYHALNRLGRPAIRIGSLGISAEGLVEHSGKVVVRGSGDLVLTTPGAPVIQGALREAVDAGLKSAVVETSSHALDQHRVSDVWYDVAVFSNLSPDHLNYHRDMKRYFRAKVGLFTLTAETAGRGGLGRAVVNLDCPWGHRLRTEIEPLRLKTTTFGADESADVRISTFEQGLPISRLVLRFGLREFGISTPLIGDYNASNIAAAFGALVAADFDPRDVARALSDVPSVPGRLESVGSEDVAVLVDYAHTGEGLEKTLSALRPFTQGRLWVVFGCGGGKDPGKRIGMGEAAAQWADRIVLTSDNPRNEDPESIIRDILKSGCTADLIELDRAVAIERTLRSAEKGDVVVLAGKGHEDYEVVGRETRFFSDRDEALKCREAGLLDR